MTRARFGKTHADTEVTNRTILLFIPERNPSISHAVASIATSLLIRLTFITCPILLRTHRARALSVKRSATLPMVRQLTIWVMCTGSVQSGVPAVG